MPTMIEASDRWRQAYPGAMIGILMIQGIENADPNATLHNLAVQVKQHLRSRYAGHSRPQLKSIPALRIFSEYYRRFGKTYHVQLQLESVLHRGKTITGPSPIVQAMFVAELKSLLLTAGHDLAAIEGSLAVDISDGTERYTLLNGRDQTLKIGDMYIRDRKGVLSSIIYGPDLRTQIERDTQGVIFTVYAPPGIAKEDLDRHLDDLEANIRLFSPEARLGTKTILSAS
jgi:DNA/RNA-binding domain of Phe-tRNA-synthetase-like protein